MALGNEMDIAQYLTIDGQVFLAPQYDIAFDSQYKEGGACPDFVALDFRRRHVVIVEVSGAYNLDGLIGRVRERESRWYKPVRRALTELSIIDDQWEHVRFLGFVRKMSVDWAKAKFSLDPDVTFFGIEDATFAWAYWDARIRDALPL